MKIKTTKELNLPELLQHLMDNEELRGLYYAPTPLRGGVRVSKSGEVLVENVWADDTFTVEVEEELTEDTVIQGLADVFFDPLVGGPNVEYHTDCIKNIKQDAMETYSLAIFYKDTLVWSRDSGIPESGVLEVDTE